MLKKIALIIVVLAVAGLGAAGWVHSQIEAYVNAPANIEKPVLVTVKEGTNYHAMTRQLVSENIISPSRWARWAAKTHPELTLLKAGTYQLQPGKTLSAIFSAFRDGKEHHFSITFVEGSRFSEWQDQLEKADHLTLTVSGKDESEIAALIGAENEKLEGLLLPETYYYVAGETDISIIRRAAGKLQSSLDKAWQERDPDLPIKSPYDLLTLASIIEKETAVDAEREKVASVFVNRLNRRMRLQTDPTVIYGMGDKYQGNIRKKDLRRPTPYNTYVIYGLPPTPIAMPGEASIIAAANPATTSYLYFVADGLGGHKFSKSLTEHNRAVRQYLKTLRK